ncbi:hypothetical protein Tco_0372501, partial [Tanacetum coccineum]
SQLVHRTTLEGLVVPDCLTKVGQFHEQQEQTYSMHDQEKVVLSFRDISIGSLSCCLGCRYAPTTAVQPFLGFVESGFPFTHNGGAAPTRQAATGDNALL